MIISVSRVTGIRLSFCYSNMLRRCTPRITFHSSDHDDLLDLNPIDYLFHMYHNPIAIVQLTPPAQMHASNMKYPTIIGSTYQIIPQVSILGYPLKRHTVC